jgi:WhiB family redox-sensing transcriptional regulator
MINLQPDWAAEEWKKWALCAEVGGEWFFPEAKCRPDPQVLRLCEACPVRQECLDYAIANRLMEGVWGGLTGKQRARYASAQRRQRQLGDAA